MTTQDCGPDLWFTRERLLTLVLAIATAAALYGCFRIVAPFIPALAFALALAIVTNRPYTWLRQRVKSDGAAAGIAIVLVALLLIGPASFLVSYLVGAGMDNIQSVRSGQATQNLRAALEREPHVASVYHWAENRFNLRQQGEQLAANLAGRLTGFLQGSLNVVTQLVITLFVLFFFYRDRQVALQSVRHLIPLAQGEADRVFGRISDTMLATVNGSITVAAVQATLGGLMFFFLGVPAPVLWAAVMFIVALIPVFGTFLVWGPIAVYLALTGAVVKAAILVGWGLLAIGTIDNLLYPYLVGDRLRLHTVPTFFAVLGGLSVFGMSGLLLGPVVLSVALALLDVWWLRTRGGHAAEEAVLKAAPSTSVSPADVATTDEPATSSRR